MKSQILLDRWMLVKLDKNKWSYTRFDAICSNYSGNHSKLLYTLIHVSFSLNNIWVCLKFEDKTIKWNYGGKCFGYWLDFILHFALQKSLKQISDVFLLTIVGKKRTFFVQVSHIAVYCFYISIGKIQKLFVGIMFRVVLSVLIIWIS